MFRPPAPCDLYGRDLRKSSSDAIGSDMSKLSMSFACGLYDRMSPLQTGEVQADGIDINFVPVHHPRDLFDRMVAGLEFDASEMSASEYITRHVAGKSDFIAIPVFPSRMFRHGF